MGRGFDTCFVICHGKSEYIFISSLRSNLKLKFIVFADKNGNKSIQITSLLKLLKGRDFQTLTSFKKKYFLNVNKGKIQNFKVFIIMDFDEQEYTQEIKANYLNKSMFKGHFLYDHIIPIFNNKNFDEVMAKAGYQIDANNKSISYNKIFSNKTGSFANFIEVKSKLSKVSQEFTNIGLVLDYFDKQYKKKVKY